MARKSRMKDHISPLVRLVDLTRKREDPNDLAVRQIGNISSRRHFFNEILEQATALESFAQVHVALSASGNGNTRHHK